MASLRIPTYILRAPATLRPLLFSRCASSSTSTLTEHLPRIAQPSLWKSFFPRFLRRDTSQPKSTGGFLNGFLANPASAVIVMALLTGNASIHLIKLKRDITAYSRAADLKIELLREVIGRVQKGEEFDVEAALGVGDPKVEEEWFDAISEIEKDEKIVSRGHRQRERRKAREEESKAKEELEKEAGKTEENSKPEFL